MSLRLFCATPEVPENPTVIYLFIKLILYLYKVPVPTKTSCWFLMGS